MDIIPYSSFLIFFILILFLTNNLIYNWVAEQCCSEIGTSLVLSLIVGSIAFIWGAIIMKRVEIYLKMSSHL